MLSLDAGEGPRPHEVEPGDGLAWRSMTVPELASLAPHFDRILVRTDGMTFEVICLKDRLADPARRLDLVLASLEAAGEACLPYTGTVQGQKMPVALKVFELCDEPAGDVAHLKPLRRLALGKKVDVSAWSLRPSDGAVWTNASLGGWPAGRRSLQALLRRAVAGEGPQASVEVGSNAGRPWLTWALVAAVVGLHLLQSSLGGVTGLLSPPTSSLVASGALFRPLVVEQGQVYRLLSAAFLHGDLVHVALNGVALYVGGRLLESLVGRAWLLAIFGLSVLGGSVASLLLNAPDVVSVGASGGIMGMLAAAAVATFRLHYGAQRTSAQLQLLGWLVPALIPLATHRSGGQVDFAGHLGGALAGLGLGLAILRSWGPRDRRPRLRRLAGVLAAVAGIALASSVALAYAGRPAMMLDQERAARLGPDEAFGRLASVTVAEAEAALIDLQQRYPRDPRTAYLGALLARSRGDDAEAEAQLRRGLDDPALLAKFFEDGGLETSMRRELALVLVRRGQREEAEGWIRPACARLAEQPAKGIDGDRVSALCRR